MSKKERQEIFEKELMKLPKWEQDALLHTLVMAQIEYKKRRRNVADIQVV
jgi:hypothetical protein